MFNPRRQPEVGVDFACYAEFKCRVCNRKWSSNKAWIHYGQKCESCYRKVKLDKDTIEPLFYYECEDCSSIWKQRYYEDGANCKKCGQIVEGVSHAEFIQYVKPRLDESSFFFDRNTDRDSGQGHRQDLCEKCKAFGTLCTTISHNQTVLEQMMRSSSDESVYDQYDYDDEDEINNEWERQTNPPTYSSATGKKKKRKRRPRRRKGTRGQTNASPPTVVIATNRRPTAEHNYYDSEIPYDYQPYHYHDYDYCDDYRYGYASTNNNNRPANNSNDDSSIGGKLVGAGLLIAAAVAWLWRR